MKAPCDTPVLTFSNAAGVEIRAGRTARGHQPREAVVTLRGDEFCARYAKPRDAAAGRARTP